MSGSALLTLLFTKSKDLFIAVWPYPDDWTAGFDWGFEWLALASALAELLGPALTIGSRMW